jgi:hypothetical protein
MGLFGKPKPQPTALAWVWDGEQWLKYAAYDGSADDHFALLMNQLPACRMLSLTTGEDGYPVLCLDGRP